MNHKNLAPFNAATLVYAKAAGDTTSGDPPDFEGDVDSEDEDSEAGLLMGEASKTRDRGWIKGFPPGTPFPLSNLDISSGDDDSAF